MGGDLIPQIRGFVQCLCQYTLLLDLTLCWPFLISFCLLYVGVICLSSFIVK